MEKTRPDEVRASKWSVPAEMAATFSDLPNQLFPKPPRGLISTTSTPGSGLPPNQLGHQVPLTLPGCALPLEETCWSAEAEGKT